MDSIEDDLQLSRRELLLQIQEKAGSKNATVSKGQFKQQYNKPIELRIPSVVKQDLNYIQNIPVLSGFVTHPEDWKYCSARNFQDDHIVLEIDDVGFLQ